MGVLSLVDDEDGSCGVDDGRSLFETLDRDDEAEGEEGLRLMVTFCGR